MKFMQIAICMKFMQIVFISMFFTISYVESLQIAICKSTTIFKRYLLHKSLVMVASEFQF